MVLNSWLAMTDEYRPADDASCVAMETEGLTPFVHQVGGHTRLLLLDSDTLCKPLIQRELNFYLNVPENIRPFVPKYKGVIKVMSVDDHVVDMSHIPIGQREDEKNGNKQLKPNIVTKDALRKANASDFKGDNVTSELFLLLQNAACKFPGPCVLDLKMGTRQHGDDAPEEKRHRHIAKCAQSTSASLGVRLCGMQVYQADSGKYDCKDKYFGRCLDEEGFRNALYTFFHNGFELRSEIISQVIDKLKALRSALEAQNSFRFYSSSLLIIYDGYGTSIDSDTDQDSESSLDGPPKKMQIDTPSTSSEDSNSCECSGELPCFKSHLADVRMIDFAHTTYDGYTGDALIHRGPDNGYLYGLKNLLRLLQELMMVDSKVS